MRQFWADLKQALYEFRHPTWPQDEPDTTTPEQIARWVESHRHPKEG